MRTYRVVPFKSSLIGGNVKESKLEDALNREAKDGWRFVRSIHETRRTWLFFAREAHFLVFEKESG